MTTTLIPLATFNVSGIAMRIIEDSDLYLLGEHDANPASQRAQIALKGAVSRKMGAGVTYVVTVDLVAAGVIWDYCASTGAPLSQDRDAGNRKYGRALLAVAERVGICCLKAGWGKPTLAHGPVPPEGVTPVLFTPAEADQKAQLVLMPRQTAQQTADRLNATGDVSHGCIAAAQPYPPESWGGHEHGWRVVEVAAEGGTDPVRARRNLNNLRDPRHWNAQATGYALVGSVGEPVRTWEDMRLALSGQMQRYLRRFPDPAGPVDDALAYRAACLITGDHYTHPSPIMIKRGQLLAYLVEARGHAS